MLRGLTPASSPPTSSRSSTPPSPKTSPSSSTWTPSASPEGLWRRIPSAKPTEPKRCPFCLGQIPPARPAQRCRRPPVDGSPRAATPSSPDEPHQPLSDDHSQNLARTHTRLFHPNSPRQPPPPSPHPRTPPDPRFKEPHPPYALHPVTNRSSPLPSRTNALTGPEPTISAQRLRTRLASSNWRDRRTSPDKTP